MSSSSLMLDILNIKKQTFVYFRKKPVFFENTLCGMMSVQLFTIKNNTYATWNCVYADMLLWLPLIFPFP